MNTPSRGRLYLSYMAMLIPAIISVIAIAIMTMNSVGHYLRKMDLRLSESIASHVLSEYVSALSISQQLAIVYGTDQNFMPELSRILDLDSMDYESLNTLRAIQRNVRMDFLTRPYISSIYFFPPDSDGLFLSAPDGIYSLDGHSDSEFIKRAISSEYSGLYIRKAGNYDSNILSFIYKDPIQSGIIIINIDLGYLEYSVDLYMSAWPDSYYKVFFNDLAVAENGEQPREIQDDNSVRLDSGKGFSIILLQNSSRLFSANTIMASALFVAALLIAFVGLAVVIVITHEKYRDYVKAGDYVKKLDEIGLMIQRDHIYKTRYDDIESYIRLQLTEYELKERHLELETLKHQLNPHIVMNTLQMLNWQLMREHKCHTALNTLVENLCKILSYSLYPSESLAALGEEISYTDSYIALQYRKSLVHIEWASPVPDVYVPRMILQPIIENALKYAFNEIADPRITVDWTLHDMVLEIMISDNGIGISEDKLENIQENLLHKQASSDNGIGLYNTNKRIQLMFGRSFGLFVESKINNGTTVTIRLPVMYIKRSE